MSEDRQICWDCRYWYCTDFDETRSDSTYRAAGECYRYPPVFIPYDYNCGETHQAEPNTTDDAADHFVWERPVTTGHDFCGEWTKNINGWDKGDARVMEARANSLVPIGAHPGARRVQ